MSTEHSCQTCGKPLEQARTGRRRKFCSTACKSRAQRRLAPLRAFRIGAKPTAPEPANQVPIEQGAHLARVQDLARALARVKAAEQELAAARATREAAHESEREWRITAAYAGDEWRQRNRGGIPASPDTGAIAEHIRRQHEGNLRQAGG